MDWYSLRDEYYVIVTHSFILPVWVRRCARHQELETTVSAHRKCVSLIREINVQLPNYKDRAKHRNQQERGREGQGRHPQMWR